MATEFERARSLGIGFLVSSLASGGASALLFFISSNEGWNFGPLIFACIAALGTVALIGFGIKLLIKAAG